MNENDICEYLKPGPCETTDIVNHPPHYTNGQYECIDIIFDVLKQHKDPVSAWLTGQIIKYIWRWPHKNGVEDLRKIRFYIDRLIAYEEGKLFVSREAK